MQARARLLTPYLQSYGVDVAEDEFARAADTCSDVGSGNRGETAPWVDIEDDERVLCCTLAHVLKLRRHVDMEWEERLLNFLVPHACAAM